jgi:hypothetical protein
MVIIHAKVGIQKGIGDEQISDHGHVRIRVGIVMLVGPLIWSVHRSFWKA